MGREHQYYNHSEQRHSRAATCLLGLAALSCLLIGQMDAFPQQSLHHNHQSSSSSNSPQGQVFARRAADDSRPLSRRASGGGGSSAAEPGVVVGKFRAPAPERFQQQRVPKKSEFASQTMSASFRVSDAAGDQPEKIVHGVIGGQSATTRKSQQTTERTVGAKMQVSDEGLNYPPSKLSADIYGNVAEIVTAPPEAVESDFLIPTSSRHQQARRSFY